MVQYAKLSMLELFYNFFTKFCDTDNYEQMKIGTGSKFPALAEKNCMIVRKMRKLKS